MIIAYLRKMRNHWLTLLLVHLVFVLLGIVVLGPLFGLLVQSVVELSGNSAVADQDIARLLLTPLGISAAVLLAGIFLAISAVEIGALLVVAMAAERPFNCTPLLASRYALRHAVGLLLLTLKMTVQILLITVPLLAVLGATGWLFLTDYDINFYLKERPPAFWWALSVTVVASVIYAWILGRKLLRWSLALPLVLFGQLPSNEALDESERLTAGKMPELVRAYAGCLALAALIGVIPHVLFNLVGGWVVRAPYEQLAPLILMLGSLFFAWIALNFFTVALGLASFAFVTAHIYVSLGPAADEVRLESEFDTAPGLAPTAGLFRILFVVAGVAGMALFVGNRLLDNVRLEDTALVIAHRGAAGAAPENTMASVHQAIADGADWVEIDVQESRDGQVVVFHDSDFMKLSGNPLKLWEGDLAEIQEQDIGSWFAPEFSGERVPTLEQVLQATRGRVRLMIELKYYGHDQQLEQRVVDLVEAAGMADEVSIMSLKLAGVQKLQALRPHWTVGLLAATSVGDLSKVDVDFLAVSARMASTRFIKRAHAGGKRVLVWTVNDALSMSKWMSMGVDGVITDEPALARNVLRERAQMSSAERLLVSAALFLGKPVPTNAYRDSSP